MILPKIDNGRNHEVRAHKSERRSGLHGGHHGGHSHVSRKKKQRDHNHVPHISTRSTFDPSTPLTLELKHGSQLHKVRLPTENLDKSKKYYVTFTIDKANGLQSNDVIQDNSFDESHEEQVLGNANLQNNQIQASTNAHTSNHHVIPQVESR